VRIFAMRNLAVPAVAILLALSAGSARADFIIEMNFVYNGTTPVAPSPFGRATFTTVSTGTVTLTMENLLPVGSQFIDDWF